MPLGDVFSPICNESLLNSIDRRVRVLTDGLGRWLFRVAGIGLKRAR